MATTTNLGLTLPTVGADDDTWGNENNAAWDGVDAVFASNGTSVSLNVGSGKTLTLAGTLAATSGTVNVSDSTFSIKDNSDATKIAQFQCSGITTATTRTLTVPDASGTLALTSDIASQTTGNFGTLTTVSSTGGGNSTTYTTQVAKYVKTGKVVTNEVELVINTASGGSGSIEFANAVSDAPLNDVSCTIGYFQSPGGISSSYQMLSLVVLAGTTTGLLYGYNLGLGSSGRITNSNFAVAGNAISYSCTYQIP